MWYFWVSKNSHLEKGLLSHLPIFVSVLSFHKTIYLISRVKQEYLTGLFTFRCYCLCSFIVDLIYVIVKMQRKKCTCSEVMCIFDAFREAWLASRITNRNFIYKLTRFKNFLYFFSRALKKLNSASFSRTYRQKHTLKDFPKFIEQKHIETK